MCPLLGVWGRCVDSTVQPSAELKAVMAKDICPSFWDAHYPDYLLLSQYHRVFCWGHGGWEGLASWTAPYMSIPFLRIVFSPIMTRADATEKESGLSSKSLL